MGVGRYKFNIFIFHKNETTEFFCSVAQMELNVFKLESGNYEYDDSEIKQKYDNQKQLNAQLQEQKRWLEHELEEVSVGNYWERIS